MAATPEPKMTLKGHSRALSGTISFKGPKNMCSAQLKPSSFSVERVKKVLRVNLLSSGLIFLKWWIVVLTWSCADLVSLCRFLAFQTFTIARGLPEYCKVAVLFCWNVFG